MPYARLRSFVNACLLASESAKFISAVLHALVIMAVSWVHPISVNEEQKWKVVIVNQNTGFFFDSYCSLFFSMVAILWLLDTLTSQLNTALLYNKLVPISRLL